MYGGGPAVGQYGKLLTNHPTGFMPIVYWQTIRAPYINRTLVQYRCNTNQKLRTVFEGKSNFKIGKTGEMYPLKFFFRKNLRNDITKTK